MPNNNNRINFQVGYNVDQASVNAVKKSLQDLQNIKFKDFNGPKKDLDDIKQKASQVEAALNKAFNVNLNSLNTQSFNTELQKAGLSIDKIYSSFSKAGAQGQVAFSRMASEVLTTNMQLKLTNSLVSQMGETMANTVKWGIASSVMNNFTNSVRQAFDYVKALDSSLNDIRIVTKQSSDEMANFAVQANNSAQALGRSTMDYTKAALTFYQQGLDEASVQARTESVLKAQNITGAGLEMADYLTAVWNGYKVANEEAELYVDKLAAVADSSASNMSLLAIAMSKVASSANLLGVPVDNLNAQIATIVATTRQAPESVGNALKTIYSRINDIATGADDALISLGNYSSKMALVGISVLDANGRLRDTGDVIDEIGGKWETLSHEQQIYLARTMAGQRQYNNLLALFENWGKYSDLVNVSMEAQGATALKNAIYMESLSAKMEQLGAAGERVKSALIDEDDLKGLVSFGTGIVNTFGTLIESIGGGKTAILALGSIFTQVFSGTIAKLLNNVVTHFQDIKNNALILKQSIASTLLLGQSQGYQSGTIKEMVDAKKEIASYYSLISAEQLKSYNSIVNEIGKNKLDVLLLQLKVSLGLKYKNAILLAALKTGLDFDSQHGIISEAIEDLTISLDKFKSVGSLKQEGGLGFDLLQKDILNISNSISTLAIPNFLLLQKLYKLISNADYYLSMGMPVEDLALKQQRYLTLVRQTKLQLSTGISYAGDFSNLQVSLDQANAKLQESINRAKEFQAAMQQFSNVKGIVDTASAIGRLASGISSIKNLGSIWTDKNLSGGEKFLKTVTNLGMAIPMLISAYKTLQTTTATLSAKMINQVAITEAMTAAEEAQIAVKNAKNLVQRAAITGTTIENGKVITLAAAQLALAAATAQATVAQLALNAAMSANPIGAIITGITLAITAITALVKIYDHFTMSIDLANTAIDNFNQKQSLLALSAKLYNLIKEKLGTADEWEDLQKKAGNYNSTIANLTESEKLRYYELSNLIALYNDSAVVGYDEQGNAIILMNHKLLETIRLLQLKHQLLIDSTYGSKEALDARRGLQVLHSQAVRTKKDALQGLDIYSGKGRTNLNQLTYDSAELSYRQGINNLSLSLSFLRSEVSEEYKKQIDSYVEDLNKITLEGFDSFSSNEEKILLIIKGIAGIRLQYPDETLSYNSFKLGKDLLLGLILALGSYEELYLEASKQIEKTKELDMSMLLGMLDMSKNNKLYNQAKEAGSFAINELISNYVLGLNIDRSQYAEDADIYQLIIDQYINGLNGILSKLNLAFYNTSYGEDAEGNAVNFEQLILNQVQKFNLKSFDSYLDKISDLITRLQGVIQNNPKIKEILNGSDNELKNAVEQYLADSFDLDDIDWDRITETISISDSDIEAGIERINSEIYSVLSDHPLTFDFSKIESFLPADITRSKLDQIIDKFILLYDGTTSWKEALKEAVSQVDNLNNYSNNISTVELLNKQASGENLSALLLETLQQGFASLSQQFPGLRALMTILQTEWLEGTDIYQKSLENVKNTIFENFEVLKDESGYLSDELQMELLTSLDSIILKSEDLQNLLNKNLFPLETLAAIFSDQIRRLASLYENCTEEIDKYNRALQVGNEELIKSTQLKLLLALRAGENAAATGINALQIEIIAEQMMLQNQLLAGNALLAADAATRFIRLNLAVEDLCDNQEKYLLLQDELQKSFDELGDKGAALSDILSDTDLFNTFEDLKSSTADLLDTSLLLLGDDWIADNIENILKAAELGGEAFESLKLSAQEEIIANIGVNFDGFEEGKEKFFNDINQLLEGADIMASLDLDDIAFLQKLVTAMLQAGYAQTEIEAALSGLGLDVDLAPYEQGLNEAIDEAMEAGKLASDNFASNAGVDATTNSSTAEAEDVLDNVGYDVIPSPVTGTMVYPLITSFPTILGPVPLLGGYSARTITYPSFRTVPNKNPIKGTKQTTATGLLVVGASKSSGGHVSHKNSPGRKTGGKGKGGGGGGGGGKAPSPATQAKPSAAKIDTKPKASTPNPYEQEEKSFDRQSKILDLLQNQLKKLVNKDRLKNLQQQNKVLEKQKDILQAELDISANAAAENSTADYARRLKQAFKDISFDKDGQIADINKIQAENASVYNAAAKAAADAFEKEKADYNNFIENTWNKYATKDLQEAHKNEKELWDERVKNAENAAKEAIKDAELVYKEREDLIKSYNDAWKDDQDRLKEYNELTLQIYDNLIAISKVKVDLSIDTGDFERDWLDFENKFIKKLDKDDFLGNAKASAKELMSYFNSKQVQLTANQIKKIRDLIAIMNAGGTSNIYGTNLAQAQEDLEEYMKQQMDDLLLIQDLVDNIKDNYLDAIDDARDKMDDQIDQYERVNDLVEHNMKMVLLLYGDKAYDSMLKYYNLQQKNNESELESLKKQQDYWKKKMDNEVVGSDAWKKFKDNLDDATDDLNSKLEDMIENLSDKWLNRVDGIIAKLNNALTGGRGLDYLDEQWDYINNYDDQFLDTFESKTGIDEVERLYQSTIDGLAGSPKSQQALNKLMNDQLKLLRLKDHLTEYDLERAKASLEVEKARLALEEARDNKTKMRLRRDSQGNYTYQYVADELKLGDLQAALADAQANLYNMDKEHYKQNLDDLYDTYKNYLEKRKELEEEYAKAKNAKDLEEKARITARWNLLQEQYDKFWNGLSEDNKYTLLNLGNSFADGMGIDKAAYSASEFALIMNQNIPQVQSNIQDLHDKIAGEGGLINATADAVNNIKEATQSYNEEVNKTLESAGTSVDTIMNVTDAAGKALDKNIQQANDLITTNQKLIDECNAQVDAIQKLLSWLDQYLNKVMNVLTLISNLRSAYGTGQQLNGSNLTADQINVESMGLDTTAGMNFTGNPKTDAAAVKQQIDALMAQYEKFLTQMSIATFDTGGYTGSWGDAEGRLAFLHQGELVLNQDDTRNILSAVLMVRSMANAINGFASGEINSLMSNATGLLGGISNTEQLDQNVHIEANFPNVTQHTEIEQAFNNLVNMASMRASGYRD